MTVLLVTGGGDPELVALGQRAAAAAGARLVVLAGLDTPDVRACGAAVLAVIAEQRPTLVLFGDDALDRAVAAWVAQRGNGGVVTGAVDLQWDGAVATATRTVFSGSGLQTCRVGGGVLPVVCLAKGAVVHGAGARTTPHETLVARSDASPRVTVVAERRSDRPRLRSARVVVSGGAGAGADGFARLRDLAALLGGATGAARGAIVNGWAAPGEKVGLTGATVTPDLYLAVGISGASQHMAGCRRSRVIVAVNRDRGAPIFRHATYGMVADSGAVLDALIAALQPSRVAAQDRIAEDAPT